MAAGVLDDAWNCPLHLNPALGLEKPFILHHHARLDERQRLRQYSTGHTQAIVRVNAAIDAFRRRHFPGSAAALLEESLAASPN
jgi:hypothetical protein